MNSVKVYKNEKARKAIRESYDALLRIWQTEIKETDLQGQYGTTHIIEWGDAGKTPLVLFHGVGDDAALMWVYNARELANHFHLFAVDTLGGPGKSVPGKGYDGSFDDVKWIDEILGQLKLDKVCVAGVSNGAYLMQLYMIRRPERVIRGVSMAGVPVRSEGNSKARAMRTMMKVFLPEALLPTDSNVRKLIKKMSGSNYRVFTENETVFRHFRQLMTGFNRAAMLNHKVTGFTEEEVLSLRDRLLCIAGKKDPFMMLGGAKLTEQLKQYQMNVVWIEDAGHGINHERAAEVNKMIIDYLKPDPCGSL